MVAFVVEGSGCKLLSSYAAKWDADADIAVAVADDGLRDVDGWERVDTTCGPGFGAAATFVGMFRE